MVPGWLKAFWLLGWALLRTVLRRALGIGRRGIGAFRENYAADGLPPVSPEQRVAMAGFGGCIACGLCDHGESARIAASAGEYTGVMALVLGASRSMPDYNAAALGFRHVPDTVLAEKELVCPTRVPIRAIAGFVREKSGDARVSLPAAAGAKSLRPPGLGDA